jgi:hypothetical protein
MRKTSAIGAKILSITVSLGVCLCLLGIYFFLTGCSSDAAPRRFLDASIALVRDYTLPKDTVYRDVPVGGISGLTYDRQQDLFYAVSDDRSNQGPARFYHLRVNPDSQPPVSIVGMTVLKDNQGQPYAAGTIDPEAIALTPRQTVLISSEGDRQRQLPPLVGEFDLASGQLQSLLTLPERYLPDDQDQRGVQNNLAFESMTLAPYGTAAEPLNLFLATEGPLVQDKPPKTDDKTSSPAPRILKNRWLHYLLGSQSGPLADYGYGLEPPPLGSLEHGLSEIQALDGSGHFLALERSLSLLGFKVKIFQVATGGATDVSQVPSLAQTDRPSWMAKQLVLDLAQLKLPLDNLEAMAIGPRLADGSNLLLLASDNNFNRVQKTQFLLLKLQVR